MDRWNPAKYSGNSQNQNRWGMELLKKARVRNGENVLDIGCGDGRITAQMAKMAGRGSVTGIDSSAKMARFAARSHKAANLKFMNRDARDFSFDGNFDLVFSNACLHWIPEQGRVLANTERALKPGGRLFFQLGGKGNAGVFNSIVTALTKEAQWKRHFRGFKFPYFFPSPSEYKRLLKENGLKPVSVKLVPKTAEFDCAKGLEMWMKTTWLPYTGRIPAVKQQRFVDATIERYLAATGQSPDKKVTLRMVRLQAEAVKPARYKGEKCGNFGTWTMNHGPRFFPQNR